MQAMRRSLVSRSRSLRVIVGPTGARPGAVVARGAAEGRTGVLVVAMAVSSGSRIVSTTHYLC